MADMRLTFISDILNVSPAPLEQHNLDSPTEEQLDADWLSQLGERNLNTTSGGCTSAALVGSTH
ncbi:hypothetical protein EYF80_047210 [Liparis tanakae]|uniref:Uncharacterized protein n=1 Tax=Liparis tanakae TaxID=230148 RepID=A0A4Z2FN58_9TELE|nr:hypothetical protein EYF80_047210 [Liparis tanakae]